jgi:hypothetical protein
MLHLWLLEITAHLMDFAVHEATALAYKRQPLRSLKTHRKSRRDHPKKKKESERVPSRKQEKYKCSIFLRE